MFSKSIPFALTTMAIGLTSLCSLQTLAATAELETVYVSATRSETSALPIASQITLIDSEQIRLSGAKLLSEILRTQAAIQLTDSDGSGGRNVTASMRGISGANNVLVLVDGRKLNNPSLAGPALNTISLKDVERIEIVQGSAGVLYGDQAVGGVINIITRKASAGSAQGFVSATRGSFNTEDYVASVSQGFDSGLSYRVSAQKRNADNYRDHNQSTAQNVLAQVRFDAGEQFFFAEAQQIEDELNLAGSLSDAAAAINPRAASTPLNYSNQDTDLWRLGGGLALADNWKLLAEYTDRDQDSESYYGGASATLSNLHVKHFTPRVIGSIATDKGASVITLGYDRVDSIYATPAWGIDVEQTINAFYGQVVYPITERLAGTLGARHSQVEDTNNLAHANHKDSVNAGELGLNFEVNNEWRLFSRIADGFRFANADENGYVLPSVDFLETQTSRTGELGAAWQGANASAQWTLYRMALDNEIMYDPVIANTYGPGANINLDSSRRQGFALDTQVTLSDAISLRFDYTYTDAELTSGSFKGNEVPYVAQDRANFVVIFTPFQHLSTYIDANYTGPRYRSGDDANSYDRVDALVLFNFNVIWQVAGVEVSGRVKNITNENYAGLQGVTSTGNYYQYPQPGRNYEMSISYSF